MRKLIILDRDGVINEDSDQYIKSVDEFVPIPGSLEAISQLCRANYSVMVATNQSGIARGYFSLATLDSMHNKLQALLAPLGGKISAFYYCPHGPDDLCQCRKPKAGMIKKIADDFFGNISKQDYTEQLAHTFVVGDSLRDLQAGQLVNTRLALVKTGKGLKTIEQISHDNSNNFTDLSIYNDLADFTHHLLNADQMN